MNEITTHSMRRGNDKIVALGDVFVSMDLRRDVAYVAYQGETGIEWDELPRAGGRLLAALGARTDVGLRSSMACR